MPLAPRYSLFAGSLSSRTPALVIVFGAVMLVLSGCSGIRWLYSYADNYFVGIVQDYFDPTPEQMRAVRAKAEQLLAWHRQNELPLYVAMFDQAAQQARDGLTEDEVSWGMAQLRDRYDALAQRIVEVNAPLLAKLSEQNLAALEGKFAAENAKLERVYLDADQARRDERRVDRVQNQFERWVGPLSSQQRAMIAAWVAAAPAASTNWYQDRISRQQGMLDALRSERDPAITRGATHRVVARARSGGGTARAQRVASNGVDSVPRPNLERGAARARGAAHATVRR